MILAHEIAVKLLARTTVPEDLTGAEGPSPLTRLLAGDFISLPLGAFHRATLNITSPRMKDLRERTLETAAGFYNSSQKWHTITSAMFHWSHRPIPLQFGREVSGCEC